MLNHIVLMGRLVRDPELRRTGSGVAVAAFSLAVDRDFAPRDGGEKETDFRKTYTKDDFGDGIVIKRGKKNFKKMVLK